MQNLNETRVLTNYPAYKISTNGTVTKVADNTEASTMKKPDSRGLARVKLYKDGKSYKETVQDLMLSVFTEEEIFGDGKTVFDTDETDDMSEDDCLTLNFWPYPDNREVWIDGNLIAVNEKLVVDYLSYLPLPLFKNPCMPYMTEKEEDNYNNLRERLAYPLTNKEKFINNWIEKYYHKDADDEYGNLDYVKAEAQREYEPIELDEWAGEEMELISQYECEQNERRHSSLFRF